MPRKKPKPASYEGKKPNNYRELNIKNREINVIQENSKQGRMKPKSVFEGYNDEKKKDKKKKNKTTKKKPTTKPKTQRVKQTPLPKPKY